MLVGTMHARLFKQTFCRTYKLLYSTESVAHKPVWIQRPENTTQDLVITYNQLGANRAGVVPTIDLEPKDDPYSKLKEWIIFYGGTGIDFLKISGLVSVFYFYGILIFEFSGS